MFLGIVSCTDEMAEEFAKLVGEEGTETEVLGTGEWDPKGEYKDVVGAVKEAVEEEVMVYRVGEGVRVEYYVVGRGEGGLVGVKANAVES